MAPSKKRPPRNLGSKSGIQPTVIVVKQKTSLAAIAGLIGILLAALSLAAFLLFRGVDEPSAKAPVASTIEPKPTATTSAPAAVVPAKWEKAGVIKGELQTIAFDPKEPSRWLLGTEEGGLMLSEDSGKSWKPLGLDGSTVLDISINPSEPDQIVAATAGGLRLTKDGGSTWLSPEGLPEGEFHVARIDPRDTEVIWAGAWNRQGGAADTFFVSKDGGSEWAAATGPMQGSDIDFVSFDENSGLTYVSAFGKGLYKSSDHGENWQAINDGLPIQSQITLLTSSKDKKVMYAGTHDFGVFRSINAGKSWESANQGKETANDVHGLAIHPENPDIVYAAGMMMGRGIYVSKNRGTSWNPLDTGDINIEDVHVFSVTPDGKEIIMGTGQHGEGTGTLYRMKL